MLLTNAIKTNLIGLNHQVSVLELNSSQGCLKSESSIIAVVDQEFLWEGIFP